MPFAQLKTLTERTERAGQSDFSARFYPGSPRDSILVVHPTLQVLLGPMQGHLPGGSLGHSQARWAIPMICIQQVVRRVKCKVDTKESVIKLILYIHMRFAG